MITKITAALTLGLAASVLVVAPAGASLRDPNPNFPSPDEWDEIGTVVPQLPAPYRIDVEGACEVATIPCYEPQVAAGMGYTIENGQLRIRLLEGSQVVNALNVEAVIEARDVAGSYGQMEVIPVCVEIIEGVPGEWRVTGDSAWTDWGPLEVGEVLDGVYLDMVATSECDPLLERRDILTIATWSETGMLEPDPYAGGWISYLGNFVTVNAPGRACRTSVACVTVHVESSPVLGGSGVLTLRYTWYGHASNGTAGSYQSSTLAPSIKATSSTLTAGNAPMFNQTSWGGGGSPTIGDSRTVSWNVTGLSCIGFGDNSSGNSCAGHYSSITTGTGNGTLVPYYVPPGDPHFNEPAEVLSSTSLTAYDVFADIVFAPYSSGAYMGGVAGVCDTLSDCMSRCENSGDALGFFLWVKCLFEPTIDVAHFWDALKLEVVRSSFVGSINTLGTYLFSPMRAIGAVGKHCGTLQLVPGGTVLGAGGFGINTCTWAEDYPTLTAWTWVLLVALVFIGGGMVILRILEGALGLHDPLIGSQAWYDKEGL